jgi:hypothetical protein
MKIRKLFANRQGRDPFMGKANSLTNWFGHMNSRMRRSSGRSRMNRFGMSAIVRKPKF